MPPIAGDNGAKTRQWLEQWLEKSRGRRKRIDSLIKVELFKSNIIGIPKQANSEFCTQIEFLLAQFVGRASARVMTNTNPQIAAVANALYQSASRRMFDRGCRLFC